MSVLLPVCLELCYIYIYIIINYQLKKNLQVYLFIVELILNKQLVKAHKTTLSHTQIIH